ncbi:MAG TPA: metalloregulator ArsR/SmtB family transcription factor [Solirubrobacterales bacterium]|nr:metalloregulator ArsR/SmtB family transcription factor [Solirubrobacterales bacterium]
METVFEVVAEPSRRGILDLLIEGSSSVGEIADRTGLSQPNVSRHLRILRQAKIVRARPQGQRRMYELRPEGMLELFGWIAPYQRLWHGSLDALERHLNEED